MMLIEGLTAKGFVNILIGLKIKPAQLLLLMFLYHDRLEGEGKLAYDGPSIANVYRYAEHVGGWSREEIEDLVEKGLMVDNNSVSGGKKQAYPDHFHVTQKFIDAVYVTSSHFAEFWDEYPSFVENFEDARKGMIPLKAAVYEEVEAMYKKRVKTKSHHLRAMEVLRWAKENNLINMGIAKYVGAAMFDQQRELMNKGETAYSGHRVI